MWITTANHSEEYMKEPFSVDIFLLSMFSTTLCFEAKLLVPLWERSTWSRRGTQLHCLPQTNCFTGMGAQKKKKWFWWKYWVHLYCFLKAVFHVTLLPQGWEEREESWWVRLFKGFLSETLSVCLFFTILLSNAKLLSSWCYLTLFHCAILLLQEIQ